MPIYRQANEDASAIEAARQLPGMGKYATQCNVRSSSKPRT